MEEIEGYPVEFEAAGRTKAVCTGAAAGRGVLLLPRAAGHGPRVHGAAAAGFSKAGVFTVFLPLLFGRTQRKKSSLRSLLSLCVRREFNLWPAGSSPSSTGCGRSRPGSATSRGTPGRGDRHVPDGRLRPHPAPRRLDDGPGLRPAFIPSLPWRPGDRAALDAREALLADGVCSAVCADQQSGSMGVPRGSGLMPPGSDGVGRERRGVVVGAHRHPPRCWRPRRRPGTGWPCPAWVRRNRRPVGHGSPVGCPSRPPFSSEPTSSFFLVSTLITGFPHARWAVA